MSYEYVDIKKLMELIKQHSIKLMNGKSYVGVNLIKEFLKLVEGKKDGTTN